MIRVVLDTNIFISGIIGKNGPPVDILKFWQTGKITIITTIPIIEEIEKVLNYPKIKSRYNLEDSSINSAILNIARYSVDVTKKAKPVKVIKEDPDDDKFLSAAIAGKADLIVSGDAHLLQLESYKGIPVLTAKDFIDRHKA